MDVMGNDRLEVFFSQWLRVYMKISDVTYKLRPLHIAIELPIKSMEETVCQFTNLVVIFRR